MHRDIIVVGTSAGGIKALRQMVSLLPIDLPATLFVVLHVPAESPSILPEILNFSGRWPAEHAREGMAFQYGHIYVAPPDRHMSLEENRLRVSLGPRENRFRPAIDPLFRSAAKCFGPRAIGIILSGTLDDGCNGLVEIKQKGGLAIVQDPNDAEFPQLPVNAMNLVKPDYCVAAPRIVDALEHEVRRSIEDWKETPEAKDVPEEKFAGLTCPECRGPIYSSENGAVLRFRCITGHSYSPEVMRVAHQEHVEDALWSAVASLREHAMLLRKLSETTNSFSGAKRSVLEKEAAMKEDHARKLEALLVNDAEQTLGDLTGSGQAKAS